MSQRSWSPGRLWEFVRSGRPSVAAVMGLAGVALVIASCADTRDPLRPAPMESLAITPLAELSLVPSATLQQDWVRLAGGGVGARGAAWHPSKQTLADGFDAKFQFRLTPSGTRVADGFAFLIQNVGTAAIGGSPLGYDGLANSLAVEFDTRTGPQNVPHVSVQPNGDTRAVASLGAAPISSLGINNGQWRTGRIAYDDGALYIFIDGTLVLKVAVQLAAVPGLLDTSGKAWVGFTAGSGSGSNTQAHDIKNWEFTPGPVLHPLEVTVLGSGVMENVTVVATNVVTGKFVFGKTGDNGKVDLLLASGGYMISAYPFQATNANQLVIWPSPHPLQSSNLSSDYGPVIWLSSIENSAPRTAVNVLKALGEPEIIGFGGRSALSLDFELGAVIACTFLDENGSALTPDDDVSVYGITPFGVGVQGLPAVYRPDGFPWTNEQLAALPRGPGFGIGTVVKNQSGCRVRGAPAGQVVLETGPVTKGGKTVIYRAGLKVGGSGEYTTVAGPSVPFAATNYYLDKEIGDIGTGPTKFGGLIAFGWEIEQIVGGIAMPSNRFTVSSQFEGNGRYEVQAWFGEAAIGDPHAVARASCSAKKCSLASMSTSVPGVTASATGVSGSHYGAEYGTWLISIDAPHLEIGAWITFRIFSVTGNNPSDSLGDGVFLKAQKVVGGGNTYLVVGVM
jgi:hypothetical protein